MVFSSVFMHFPIRSIKWNGNHVLLQSMLEGSDNLSDFNSCNMIVFLLVHLLPPLNLMESVEFYSAHYQKSGIDGNYQVVTLFLPW